MLKKLLLALMFGLSFAECKSMEPKTTILYEGPQQTYSKNNYEINALDGSFEVGSIMYEVRPFIQTEISLFEVTSKYRNNKTTRIGQNLFQRCINHALEKQCPTISWTVIPQDKDLDLKMVCMIYEKMVKNLTQSNTFIFTKSEPYGSPLRVEMTLSVKK